VLEKYKIPRSIYWLRRMENYGRKERVPVAEYTIEHILPQNDDLSEEWKAALGADWQRVQETWLHTLGNLTLTGYNSEYSDHPFAQKRDKEGGFKDSPLKLNEGLGHLQNWDEAQIKERAVRLAKLAQSVWLAPKLPDKKLADYKKKKIQAQFYTIEDHPKLSATSKMRPIFDAFRKEVLELDPVVTEEFLKLYVAYKAETNFVDVEPQTARLRLTLNMAFHEIDDPRKICKNVAHLGAWGNGEVSVGLSSLDELPYIMGLVRQSFEKQMGNGESA